jgi:hypothetical protein
LKRRRPMNTCGMGRNMKRSNLPIERKENLVRTSSASPSSHRSLEKQVTGEHSSAMLGLVRIYLFVLILHPSVSERRMPAFAPLLPLDNPTIVMVRRSSIARWFAANHSPTGVTVRSSAACHLPALLSHSDEPCRTPNARRAVRRFGLRFAHQLYRARGRSLADPGLQLDSMRSRREFGR